MTNKTNYEKSRKHSHKTLGFSLHPNKAKEAKKMLYELCLVFNYVQRQKENLVIEKAKENKVDVALGKKFRLSQSQLIYTLIELEHKDLGIEDLMEKVRKAEPILHGEDLQKDMLNKSTYPKDELLDANAIFPPNNDVSAGVIDELEIDEEILL
tara:strand:- start:155 stop:616 length:462 start_codon:yes stop_codon:yes gene_type:complete